ncbi:DUF1772 domain-containing protein [Saccharopolyspora sp. NPDC050389]|uniref:DUF1772 domain-containing protein n=1 Tax=Saccharopolyspora sp. NPDC050389 TaxID=3155516 RepID=UPI0033EA2F26
MPAKSNIARLAAGSALLATGVLSGAFFYGWANVTPTFSAVPLDVHLAFRVELMKVNGVVMQILMAAAVATSGWLAFSVRGRARTPAIAATAFAVASFLVTRFGNVPINQEMKRWAAGQLAPDYLDRLAVWGTFNDIRVATALTAFVLVIIAAGLTGARR